MIATLHHRAKYGTIIQRVAHGYPMLLDLSNRLVVIVGGGAVAARKAVGVIGAGAGRIRCVAPAFCAELPTAVERITAEYADQHLDGAGLVFAATDQPEVNSAVVRDARRRGVLVNRADTDEAEPADFSTPARWQEGPVIVTVSAGSPALSALIRDDLRHKIDRRYVQMAEAMQELRPIILRSRLDPRARATVFRAIASQEAIEALNSGGMDGLRDWMARRFPELFP